jgi:threonylcarbamoyladenosine tRNA methylthiotransferase MtaB
MLKEVELLVSKGFREIVLTGICLGMWGEDLDPPGDLADALTALKGLKGDFRIRLSSIEPKYVSSSLIDLIAREARICKHLHIPLQSGDDEVLRRMKRPYTRREYSSLIRDIRSKVPGIGITTDVMVGFPGESEENFRNTLELVKEMQPARVHIFPFSRRDGTAACEYQDTLKRKDLKKRYDAIKAAAMEASYRYRKAFEGKVADVLVETKRHRQTGMLQGYSGNYIKIIFIGPDDLSGRIVPVKVGAVATDTTRGEII